MTLYTLQYNNYYNRIKKGFDTMTQYLPFVVDTFQNINFNPNDNITTSVVLNTENHNVDYLIAENENNEIVSRWYIMEAVRLREGQWKIELLRDVIWDYREQVVKAPMMVSRGWTYNGDKAIFNDESIAVSQIKQHETLLKDSSKAAWIVGYMANPKAEDQDITITYGLAEPEADISVSTFDEWQYSEYAFFPEKGQNSDSTEGYEYTYIDNYSFLMTYGTGNYSTNSEMIFNQDGFIKSDLGSGNPYWYVNSPAYLPDIKEAIQDLPKNDLAEAINNYYDNTALYTKMQKIKNLKKKTLYIAEDDTFYEISVITSWKASEQVGKFKPNNSTHPVVKAFTDFINAVNDEVGDVMRTKSQFDDGYNYFVNFGDVYTFKIELTKISMTAGSKTFTIPKTVRTLKDAPYRMFCMPYALNYRIQWKKNDTVYTKYTSEINTLSIATVIMGDAGANVYDVQLLPYCPIANLRKNNMYCNLNDFIENVDYVFIEDVPTIIFFSDVSQGTFNISLNQDGVNVGNTIATKANSLTRFCRLCSPNYQGVFEYSPIKNYGVSQINVDFHYKPYSPYIHLNPDFYLNGIYGSDFNDARGLICGGDFSITRISDAWTDYELQNKNYNTIFDKGIQKLETENKYARIADRANAAVGTLSGTATGIAAGFSVGGGVGAAIGGAIGGVSSLAGGITDVYINDQLRQLNKQHTIDVWNLQLDNIKAIPYSLSKVSAFNNNNKIWPFVEYYACSQQEYKAVYEYIEYRGMRLDRIGTIEQMLPYIPASLDYGFIQGDIIRLDNLEDDTHVATVISNELRQGVYL